MAEFRSVDAEEKEGRILSSPLYLNKLCHQSMELSPCFSPFSAIMTPEGNCDPGTEAIGGPVSTKTICGFVPASRR